MLKVAVLNSKIVGNFYFLFFFYIVYSSKDINFIIKKNLNQVNKEFGQFLSRHINKISRNDIDIVAE